MKLVGWLIFCLLPAFLVGVIVSAVWHPVPGLVVGLGVLGFFSSVGKPRPERGEG